MGCSSTLERELPTRHLVNNVLTLLNRKSAYMTEGLLLAAIEHYITAKSTCHKQDFDMALLKFYGCI